MEFNQLPENFEGEQKRQTEFDSLEAKLTYDAGELIKITKAQFERTGVNINPIALARRVDDDIPALQAEIAKQQTAVDSAVETAASAETAAPAEAQKHELSPEDAERILQLLKTRFQAPENRNLCQELDWSRAETALKAAPESLWSVFQMEQTGHEPGVYFVDKTGFDVGTLSKEAPRSTRNCVYDAEAEVLRTDDVSNGNAEAQAKAIGVDLQTVEQGSHIAKNTPAYDEQEWRWYKTPANVRKFGDALCGARSGDALVTFRYSANTRYAGRGWGGSLRVNFVD